MGKGNGKKEDVIVNIYDEGAFRLPRKNSSKKYIGMDVSIILKGRYKYIKEKSNTVTTRFLEIGAIRNKIKLMNPTLFSYGAIVITFLVPLDLVDEAHKIMKEFEPLLEEMIDQQKKRLLRLAREMIPYVTDDDLLQPNDFPELENHPFFRHEEGYLQGLLSAKSALLALKKDLEKSR